MPQPPVVVACDESGAEGENLTSANHRVFAHGSVDLSAGEAEAVMAQLRVLAPSQAPEYKSSQLLKPRNREALLWLLSSGGPLDGRASAYLVDKEYFVVGKVIDLLIEEMTHEAGFDLYANDRARTMARDFHRNGPRAFGSARWNELLLAFNGLMRVKKADVEAAVNRFFTTVDQMRLTSHRRDVELTMGLVWRARNHATSFQEALVEDPQRAPTLDPLLPSIVQTARYWYQKTRRPVRLIHDNQSVLTERRVTEICDTLQKPIPEFRRYFPAIKLDGIELVDSRFDARVQVADLLAGAARAIATGELQDQGDSELLAALQPLVSEWAMWSDERSYRSLTGKDL